MQDWGRAHLSELEPANSKAVEDIPAVYAAAVAAVEQYGWEAIHGRKQEWTALHWSAAAGHVEVCHRLLVAMANPEQLDQSGAQ